MGSVASPGVEGGNKQIWAAGKRMCPGGPGAGWRWRGLWGGAEMVREEEEGEVGEALRVRTKRERKE